MEGEADLVIGVTKEMCQSNNIEPARWIVSLPEGTLFWIPPGVPLTMNGLYWERPNPEKAYSRIFWMQISPTGARCHFCTTAKGKNWAHPLVFSPSMQMWPLASSITQELKEQSPYHQDILEYLLQLLLTHTVRGLLERPTPSSLPLESSVRIASETNEQVQVIERALVYISDHYKDVGLTTADVADHVHLSTTHLGRLFRKHLQTSVRQTIINIRLEKACHFLENSQYNVRLIGSYCGYAHTSTFIAAFEKRTGKSPLTYRREYQEENNG